MKTTYLTIAIGLYAGSLLVWLAVRGMARSRQRAIAIDALGGCSMTRRDRLRARAELNAQVNIPRE